MRLSFGRKLTLAFAAAFAILLATAVVSYRNTRELLRTNDEVSHSQSVLAAIDGIASAMSDAESFRRSDDQPAGQPAGEAEGQTVNDHVGVALGEIQRSVRASEAQLLQLTASGSSTRTDLTADLAALHAHIDARLGALGADARKSAPPITSPEEDASARAAAADRRSLQGELARLRERMGRELRARSAAAREGADRAEQILQVGLILVLLLAPLAFLMVRNDFRVRLASERALQESEARFRAAADGSLDAFYVLRAVRDGVGELLDFEFVDLNARAESLLGLTRDLVLGQRMCELIPSNRSNGYVEKYRRVLETAHVLEEEFEVTSRDYDAAWIHHQVVPLDDGVAITSRDITERKRQEEALRALSLVDELTGLYNRRGFLALAQQQLKQALRGHRELVLLFVDMDDFKEINDTFGHNEGDAALIRASEILKHTFRDSDIIARMGGDEFVVLATDTGKTGSEIIINRLRQELRERNEREGYPYRLSFTVGAALFDPDAPPSVDELLATADAMLYAQKKHKRQTAPSVG
ncbi:MAG: sensor domain-containing diguanylate cyclase [Gemmatimonadota bacterium]